MDARFMKPAASRSWRVATRRLDLLASHCAGKAGVFRL